MRRFVLLLLALGVASVTVWVASDGDGPTREDPPGLSAVREAAGLVVYEGLPHPLYQTRLLDAERAGKATMTRHDELFYPVPLDVTPSDREALRGLLGEAGSFRPWRGEKKCGGFHPDYLAEWRAGDARYEFLICFGCKEVKVYPGDGSRFDLTGEAATGLKAILEKYRKNRPVDTGQ
jgi:hypothetical protein